MDCIILPEKLHRQMMQHAKAAIPMEAVGMIGGNADGVACLVIELPNLAGKNEFFADPFAQYEAERRFSNEGLGVIAIYHSHPGGGVELSEADQIAAARWHCAHIIIVPERDSRENDHMRGYRVLGPNKVVEIQILRDAASAKL